MRRKPVRTTLIRSFGAVGIHTVKRARKSDVARLIESLRPFDPGRDLIRLGPEGDGGYLVPDDLDGIKHAFSPGVSTESGFEADLAGRGMQVHMADFSVDQPAQQHANFAFTKKYVGSFPSATTMTMDDWKQQTIPDFDGDLLLQMDIESAEFETLFSLSPNLLAQFRIMVIEFHHLHQLWNKPWFRLVSRVFQKLLAHHSVVHIHPNNCCGSLTSRGLELPRVLEFTFLRNDRFLSRSMQTQFPHPLDRNNTAKPTLVLPSCWYQADG